jgi:hypothetical protein
MAFDWLGQDIGGYKNAVNDPGGLGVSQGTGATGITWQQLLSAAGQPGQQQMYGSGLPFGSPQQQYAPPKTSAQLYQLPQKSVLAQGQQQDSGDDWGSIIKMIANIFAPGAGAA